MLPLPIDLTTNFLQFFANLDLDGNKTITNLDWDGNKLLAHEEKEKKTKTRKKDIIFLEKMKTNSEWGWRGWVLGGVLWGGFFFGLKVDLSNDK